MMKTRKEPTERGSATTLLLAVCFLITAVLVGLRLTGSRGVRSETPREIGEAYLAAARAEAGLTKDDPEGDVVLRDVAPELGIRFTHDSAARGSYLFPEEMGPGAGFIDYDDDGDLDIFVAAGGRIVGDAPVQRCRLYRNDGTAFVDVSEQTGAAIPGPAYGVAVADYDDDGDSDIYLTRLGPNVLLRNEGGTFRDVARGAGVADPGFGTSAAFFDGDKDGILDLYLVNYIDWSPLREKPCSSPSGSRDYCAPGAYDMPAADRLYRGLPDGRFEDVSQESGISGDRGQGLGVVASDFDDDGWPDLYIANDSTPAMLWLNRGDGTYEEAALLRGCAYDENGVAIAGMGVVAEDLDGDADLDLIVTNIRGQHHLTLENDEGFFRDRSIRSGFDDWSRPATGFGVAWFDQDHDGALDLYVANGAATALPGLLHRDNPYGEPDHFARFVDGRFVERNSAIEAHEDTGRGLAAADFDDDGDLDLLLTNNGGPLRLFRNEEDSDNHWWMLDLRVRENGRRAIGARVIAKVGDRTLVREVRPHQSYLTSGDPRIHFGLGSADKIDEIEIRWPDGTVDRWEDLPVDRHAKAVPGVQP